eukprot:CAMPEP_0195508788 /NCGR_PEP_ID=MMETSP0794_2-20130614/1898_1 /TAXON_ID=515487 /ORGANISM="Stephanopyxis turris, Strain CCMP 815" /LENGTH=682 /DNA_ID=CAMNT_0040635841 /DNA_START=21 /DNA_END=2069 /DNA_ORIENTATION=+
MFSYPGAKKRNKQKKKPQQAQPQQAQSQHQAQQYHYVHNQNAPSHHVPSLSDLRVWFDYHDRDRNGQLDREEVVAALMTTNPFTSESPASVRDTVYNVWPAFDLDGSGYIEKHEFVSPGGLGDTLRSLNQRASAQAHAPPAFAPQQPTALPAYAPQQPASPYAPHVAQNAPQSSNPHVYVPQVYVPQQQQEQRPPQPTTETMQVSIPNGMQPGQQLRVRGTSGQEKVTTIPPYNQWRSVPGAAPFFLFNMEVANTAPVMATATPVIVPGSIVGQQQGNPSPYAPHVNSTPTCPHNAASSSSGYNYKPNVALSSNSYDNTSDMTQTKRKPFRSYDNFSSHSYIPPPLGMLSVPHSPSHVNFTIPPSGRRKALLIGINYKGTRAELKGCVNDAKNMKQLLISQGFPSDSSHMVVLVDERNSHNKNYLPTHNNILKAFQWLIDGLSEGDVAFFHFSGHGAQTPDKTGHEADGFNETILPLDFQKHGQITDDTIFGSIVYPLPSGVRMTAIMDCCHSGTGLDLPFEFKLDRYGSKASGQGRWVTETNPAHSQADVLLFSGCEDSQTSADTFDKYQAGGAMTQSFIKAYQQNPRQTYPQLLQNIHTHLKRRGFSQRPQLTTSQRFDAGQRVFSFVDGIEPNRNAQVGRMKNKHVKAGKNKQKKKLMDELFANSAAVAAGAILAEMLF